MQNSFDPDSDRSGVRPFFRGVGALLTSLLAYLYAAAAIPLFVAERVDALRCTERKQGRQLICEFERWLMSGLADELQGPVRAVGYLLFAALWVCATWWLLKPLFVGKASRP